MRYLFIIIILLSLIVPVWAQGDGNPLYTIDDDDWFITETEDGGTFYATIDDLEPQGSFSDFDNLPEGEMFVNIRVGGKEEIEESTFPSNATLFIGVEFGIWVTLAAFFADEPVFGFSDVETVEIAGMEFTGSTLTLEGAGSITAHAIIEDDFTVSFDIYHHEDTDIAPALELLETFELQLPE